MNLYCLVEDDSIIEGPKPLPGSWKNISGLDCMAVDKLKDHGWLPVTQNTPTYDSETQKLGNIILDSILEDEVIYTRIVSDITSEDKINVKVAEFVATEYETHRADAIDELIGEGAIPSDYTD